MSKKQPKLTPWFPGDVKPVRVGLYQRKYDIPSNQDCPDFWDGEKWILCGGEGFHTRTAMQQSRSWRGLAVKP